MYIKKSEAQIFTIPGGSTGILYPPHPAREQSIAVVEMDGVYPEKGYSLNDRCTETFLVLEGSFVLECDGQQYSLAEGDLFVVLPGKKYRIEGKGKVVDYITPSWDAAQNHIVDA